MQPDLGGHVPPRNGGTWAADSVRSAQMSRWGPQNTAQNAPRGGAGRQTRPADPNGSSAAQETDALRTVATSRPFYSPLFYLNTKRPGGGARTLT